MPDWRAGTPDASWDGALARAGGHFLQSSAWQDVQTALGSSVIHSHADSWLWAGHTGRSMGVRYLYVPCGPTVISAAAFADCMASLATASRESHISFVRLEPMGAVDLFQLADAGAQKVRSVQPEYTWLLDLRDDEELLRRGLTKGHRSSINAAARRGITVRRSDDPRDSAILEALIHRTAAARGFHPAPSAYYRAMAEVLMPRRAACLYIAEVNGSPVSAALGFDFNGVRHYAHAGSDPDARRLQAAVPLVWRMIVDARAQGMHTFDFWGVLPHPQKNHPWNGFTQFKQSFGGRMEQRAGTWELPVRRWRHRLHRLARTARR